MKEQRRSMLKKLTVSLAGIFGLGYTTQAETNDEKAAFNVTDDQEIPLFSGATKHRGFVFVAGKGAHFEGDIKAHTEHVLKELEKELKNAGSSMDKVVKVNVYLNDIKDYQGMNEVYRGKFGSKPPVRTTVGVGGGVPGNSLVEMDCIAIA
jgi:2-iminobutanoate/2-iminopropanoate deaminase